MIVELQTEAAPTLAVFSDNPIAVLGMAPGNHFSTGGLMSKIKLYDKTGHADFHKLFMT